MKMKKINILCLQETKWVRDMAKTIVGDKQEGILDSVSKFILIVGEMQSKQ